MERQREGRPDPAFRRKTSGKNDLQDHRTSQQRYLPPMPFTSAGTPASRPHVPRRRLSLKAVTRFRKESRQVPIP